MWLDLIWGSDMVLFPSQIPYVMETFAFEVSIQLMTLSKERGSLFVPCVPYAKKKSLFHLFFDCDVAMKFWLWVKHTFGTL